MNNCRICNDSNYVTVDPLKLPKDERNFLKIKRCSCMRPCPECNDLGFILKQDEKGRETAVRCFCVNLDYKIRMFNAANIPAQFINADFSQSGSATPKWRQIATEAKRHINEYAKGTREETKHGFLVCGSVGTGKTWLAVCMLKEYIFRYSVKARFVEFTKLLTEIKAGYDQGLSETKLLENLNSFDVLVVDELGKGRQSEWENYILDVIISSRYNFGKVTIFTSNYTDNKSTTYKEAPYRKNASEEYISQTLLERVQPRIYSRLKGMCSFFELIDNDLRTNAEVVC